MYVIGIDGEIFIAVSHEVNRFIIFQLFCRAPVLAGGEIAVKRWSSGGLTKTGPLFKPVSKNLNPVYNTHLT